jgi:acetyl-CoA carboxylase carboxyl transferase subunit alpha
MPTILPDRNRHAEARAAALEAQLADVHRELDLHRRRADKDGAREADLVRALEARAAELREALLEVRVAWHAVALARHPQRPKAPDFIGALITDFTELHGDRLFRDDPALTAGIGWFDGRPVVALGPHKGKDTRENLAHNFGMPYPEGYRKALRVMKLAEKFGHPIISFVDTPAAYPGDAAEERGQAEAIARNIAEMTRLRVPVLVVITGEGGSGGALAIAVGDTVLMLEHAIYTVIPPEGCAAILWHDATRAREAASALRLVATDLRDLRIVDEIIPEPHGGAHVDPPAVFETVRAALRRHLAAVTATSTHDLLRRRYDKYRRIGYYEEPA